MSLSFSDQDLPPPINPRLPTVSVEVEEIGSPHVRPGEFSTFRTLACFVAPATHTYEAEWVLPDETIVTSRDGRFDSYVFLGPAELAMVLNITRVTYTDEGVYTCRYRDTSSTESKWYTNTTQLLLSGMAFVWRYYTHTVFLLAVNLDVYPSNRSEISTFDNVTQVSLSCEMSLYLRPEEDLQWFRGGQLIAGDSGRLSLTYSAGTAQGQFGGDTVGLSQVSTLVISQPQTSDSGTYRCTIRNTSHSQDIQLTVESAGIYTTRVFQEIM